MRHAASLVGRSRSDLSALIRHPYRERGTSRSTSWKPALKLRATVAGAFVIGLPLALAAVQPGIRRRCMTRLLRGIRARARVVFTRTYGDWMRSCEVCPVVEQAAVKDLAAANFGAA